MTEWDQMERRLKAAVDDFLDPKPGRRRAVPSPAIGGYEVDLVVRMGPLKPETIYRYHSDSLSKLEAQIDAEKSARKEGWATVARVHAIRRL